MSANEQVEILRLSHKLAQLMVRDTASFGIFFLQFLKITSLFILSFLTFHHFHFQQTVVSQTSKSSISISNSSMIMVKPSSRHGNNTVGPSNKWYRPRERRSLKTPLLHSKRPLLCISRPRLALIMRQ